MAVDLHCLELVREWVQLEVRDVFLAEVDGGAEGADRYDAVEGLLELVGDILGAVKHRAGDDEVEALVDLLAEHLAQVDAHQLLSLDFRHGVVLLDNAWVHVDLCLLHGDADGVPLGGRALWASSKDFALAGHQLFAHSLVALTPVSVPATGAVLFIWNVAVLANAGLAAAAVALALDAAEEWHAGVDRSAAPTAEGTESTATATVATAGKSAAAATGRLVVARALGVRGEVITAGCVPSVIAAIVVTSAIASVVPSIITTIVSAVIPSVIASIISAVVPSVITTIVSAVIASIISAVVPSVIASIIPSVITTIIASVVSAVISAIVAAMRSVISGILRASVIA